MTDRDLVVQEVYDRIKRDRDVLEILGISWGQNDPIDKIQIPHIYIFEGLDEIVKGSGRSGLGYPATRKFEVEIEIVVKSDRADRGNQAVKALYRKVRRTIFSDRDTVAGEIVYTANPVLAPNTVVKESRMKGPGLYDVPELVGIKLVLEVIYIDNGI